MMVLPRAREPFPIFHKCLGVITGSYIINTESKKDFNANKLRAKSESTLTLAKIKEPFES
jgi:hypothetical protein